MNRNNLLQLLKNNLEKPKLFQVKAEDDDEATIYVYDVIGSGWYGGVSAQDFARQLANIQASTIHLRINSPGGDVWDGRAMMTALKQHSAKVVAHIDGVAASAATSLVMAADEVEISRGAEFMIHNAWSIEIGNRHDFIDMAERLESIDSQIVTDYERRTNLGRDELTQMMDDETWFTAEQVVDYGFADRLIELVGDDAENVTQWDLSAYDNAPESEPEKPSALQQAQAHHAHLDRRFRLIENRA